MYSRKTYFANLNVPDNIKIKIDMDYKEKYEELRSKIQNLHDRLTGELRQEIEEEVPETIESEDEKIRKCLIKHFRNKSKEDWNGVPVKSILAWLEKQSGHAKFINGIQVGDKVTRNEDGVLVNLSQLNRVAKKQGEQKPLVIPKFRKGDFIRYKTNPDDVKRVDCVMDNYYILDIKGECIHVLFTCQDLWELVEQKPVDKVEPKFKVGDKINQVGRPNEPCYILTVTTVDTDIKCYICNQATVIEFKEQDQWHLIEQKSADEVGNYNHKEVLQTIINEQKPSEDEDREYACQSSEHYTRRELMIYNLGIADGKRMIEDAIKETEQKPVWNEEDNRILKEIISDVKFEGYNNDMQANSYKKINWLKSLKDRYTWKPSKEQMEALYKETQKSDRIRDDRIVSLYNDLKKLKDEK